MVAAMSEPEPATRRARWWEIIVWVVARGDDFIAGILFGFIASVVHVERWNYTILDRVLKGDDPDGVSVRLPGDGHYVVLSDHHLLYQGAPHDYVSGYGLEPFTNERILRQILNHYADRGVTLIENGDVEDLIVQEPKFGTASLSLFLQGIGGPIGWWLFRRVERARRTHQLARVQMSYAGLMGLVKERFFDKDKLVKLFGNHETDMRHESVIEQLRTVYPDATLFHYAIIESTPPVVVCHGHQFDPWTNQWAAPFVGESITEAFAWAGQGADRIWLKDSWGPDIARFDNALVRAPSMAKPEPGTFLPKVRHMGERYMVRKLEKVLGTDRPWLVLGHSHEPRLREVERYANSGAAGRYQDLVWAVHVDDGVVSLHAWIARDGVLVRREFTQDGEHLIAGDEEEHGPLESLPWTRPSREELDEKLGQPPTFGLMVRMAFRAWPLVAMGLLLYWWVVGWLN
jgi:hypothetical protein